MAVAPPQRPVSKLPNLGVNRVRIRRATCGSITLGGPRSGSLSFGGTSATGVGWAGCCASVFLVQGSSDQAFLNMLGEVALVALSLPLVGFLKKVAQPLSSSEVISKAISEWCLLFIAGYYRSIGTGCAVFGSSKGLASVHPSILSGVRTLK